MTCIAYRVMVPVSEIGARVGDHLVYRPGHPTRPLVLQRTLNPWAVTLADDRFALIGEAPAPSTGEREPSIGDLLGGVRGREAAKAARRRRWPKACKDCGATFQPLTENVAPCDACQQKLRDGIPTTCSRCGETFPRHNPRRMYCDACRTQRRPPPDPHPCRGCGREFQPTNPNQTWCRKCPVAACERRKLLEERERGGE
jgi:hypothetical protein